MNKRIWSRTLASALLVAGCGDSTAPASVPGPEESGDRLTVAESHTLMGLLAGLGVEESDSPGAPELPFTIACPGGGTALGAGMISTIEESEGTAKLEIDVEIELRDCVLRGEGVAFALTANPGFEQTGTVAWTVDGLDFTLDTDLRMSGEFSFDVGDRSGSCSADFTYTERISTEQNVRSWARMGRLCGHDLEEQVAGMWSAR
ncbi:hypothetical protein [Candidatus Palauibacter sp.]|uniref:hypothetical protein n=1 Tax=Candidatus Palauibacter sp. TaxID=3101350 RepID=UPI003B02B1B6